MLCAYECVCLCVSRRFNTSILQVSSSERQKTDGTGREARGFNHKLEVPVRELREFRGISEFVCRSVLDPFWKFPIFCGGHVWCFASF